VQRDVHPARLVPAPPSIAAWEVGGCVLKRSATRRLPWESWCSHCFTLLHTLCRFDLVIATDVLYEHWLVPKLASVIEQLTTAPPRAAAEAAEEAASASGRRSARVGGEPTSLLLAEYPDRYPTNLSNFQALLAEPPTSLHLESVDTELVPLPPFLNEMLDIEIDPERPVIKTAFLLFKQSSSELG
jgi:hypothetical protein